MAGSLTVVALVVSSGPLEDLGGFLSVSDAVPAVRAAALTTAVTFPADSSL